MKKIKLLLDTDLGSDCDDTGALAVLHTFANMGKAEIKGVVHCGSEISGAVAIKSINTWYQRADIPVGRWEKSIFLEDDICCRYTKILMQQYLNDHEMPEFENSTRLMRRILAANEDITIAVIGMLNNVAELLKSEPDDISPLNGVQLVKRSVNKMYVMGGNFDNLSHCEYNIVSDVKNAQYVAENFPVSIIYCGFELGESVITGRNLRTAPNEHPVRIAYERNSAHQGCVRSSWDPITVYCAVEQSNHYYKLSEPMQISFDDKGRVRLSEGGKDYYLKKNISDYEAEQLIDSILK